MHLSCPICRKDVTFSDRDLSAVCFAHILDNRPVSICPSISGSIISDSEEPPFRLDDSLYTDRSVALTSRMTLMMTDEEQERVLHTASLKSLPVVE